MAIALLLPIALALGLAVPEISGALDRAERMKADEEASRIVVAAVRLAHALENERDFAALAKQLKVDTAPYRAETDKMLAAYQALGTTGATNRDMAQRVADTRKALQGLPETRAKAYTKDFRSVATDLAYADMITPLLSLPMEVARGGGSNAADIWALSSLSIGKASISSQRALLNAGFSRSRVEEDEQTEAMSHGWLQKVSFREFRTAAQEQDVAKFKKAFDASYVSAMVGKARTAHPSELDARLVKEWNGSATRIIDDLHEIEQQIARRIAAAAAHERYEAQKAVWWNGGTVACALLLTFLLAAWMVQATVRQLGRLRRTALRAARQELPALVGRVAERGTVDDARPVALDLGTRDEIGDVSRAFEQVFREAVKQTAEQAALRASVNSMLASMARRNQVLVYRQLDVIGAVGQEVTDPAMLKQVFHIDHLATRMRRHGENLLVLAGERPGRVHQVPAPLVDVVRAAASEVEQFTRVEVVVSGDVWVAAPVVHDLTHLLAELMDNATQYSDPSTQVVVTTRPTVSGDVLIDVEDNGVGLSAPTVERLNEGLARTSAVDASVARQMGLYVVSRLAAVHGIQVRLSSLGKGTTASVVLPASCVAAARPLTGAVEETENDTEPPGPLPPEAAPAPVPASKSASKPALKSASEPVPEPAPDGLPRRTPQATIRERTTLAPADADGAPRKDAAELRRRVSGFYAGANRARQELRGEREDRSDV